MEQKLYIFKKGELTTRRDVIVCSECGTIPQKICSLYNDDDSDFLYQCTKCKSIGNFYSSMDEIELLLNNGWVIDKILKCE